MRSILATQALVKDKQTHLKVTFPSAIKEIIHQQWNSNKSKEEIVNSQIILFSLERPANPIKIQIFSELKVAVSSFKSLHRTRKLWGRGSQTLLPDQMWLVMMRLPWRPMMDHFINQFRLVRKIDGEVLFLLDPNKMRSIEKYLLRKTQAEEASMAIKKARKHGRRKPIWPALSVKRPKWETCQIRPLMKEKWRRFMALMQSKTRTISRSH